MLINKELLPLVDMDFMNETHFEDVDLINELHQSIVTYAKDSSNENFEILKLQYKNWQNHTINHFKTEEDLFIKYKYPEYSIHKKEHDDFIAYVESVNLLNIDDNQKQFLKELLGKIVQWVFKHIITTDFMYKDYLIRLGMK